MKITSSILSIPPYLSTTWKNISSLHVKEERGFYSLIVILQNRVQVEVPGLNKGMIDSIFEAHARSAEEENSSKNPIEGPFSFSLPMRVDKPIDSLGSAMMHNPEQSDLPPLPPEILDKITMIAKAFGLEDTSALPSAKPDCHCMYCQVARSLKGEELPADTAEEVTEADLSFRNWDIEQIAEQLYKVTNPLDANEHYNVFLGTPLGCTCGLKNCEHIRAVLNT